MALPEPEYARERIHVSVTPELRERVQQIAQMLGLSESAAARHLMLRGLEGMMAITASHQTATTLSSMFAAMEREMEKEKRPSRRSGKVVRDSVTPELRDKNVRPALHLRSALSDADADAESFVLDMLSGPEKKPRGKKR